MRWLNSANGYYTFFSSQMNNEMLIIIMLGLIARDNRREIEFLKNADFFKNVDMGGNVALNRIRQLYFSSIMYPLIETANIVN